MRLLIYILTFNNNPDIMDTCMVPWPVDGKSLFYGPCKTRIRELLRKEYLKEQHRFLMREPFWMVGLSGGNIMRRRAVVYFGRVTKLMTFEEAHRSLTSPRFKEMREHLWSPMHAKPMYGKGRKLTGYENISDLHFKDAQDLVSDFCNNGTRKHVSHIKENRKVILEEGTREEVFVRDCCFLMERGFFAEGQGITVDEKMLKLLREAQPDREGVVHYAPFGENHLGHPDGRKGGWLELNGKLAERMLRVLRQKAAAIGPMPTDFGAWKKWAGPGALARLGKLKADKLLETEPQLLKCPNGPFLEMVVNNAKNL